MKFQVSDGEKFQKIMEVEISPEELEPSIKVACKQLAAKANIPGFRKGKAPRSVLENYIGIDAILEEAADDILPKAYIEGLKETGLQPVCQPEVEMVSLAANEPFKFKTMITVKPDIKLGDYNGLPITRTIIDVLDEDVDDELEKQRERMTKLIDAEADSQAANGDTINIDFKGRLDGEYFEGGSAEDYPLELGSNSFIPGFEEQLIGCKTGEEKDIEISFPEDYHAKELAGKAVVFEVKVKSIKTKVTPALDQEFVEEVSETAENLDQLKEEIKTKLTEESTRMATDSAHNNAIIKAVENCEVELPPIMVEQQIDDLVKENESQMANSGITMEQYLEYVGLTMDQLREEFRKQAEFIVKRELMIDAIIKAENIEVSEEELDEQISGIASKYQMSKDQVKEMLGNDDRLDDFQYEIKKKKVADLIYDNAVVTDEHTTNEELAKKAAKAAKKEAKKATDSETKE